MDLQRLKHRKIFVLSQSFCQFFNPLFSTCDGVSENDRVSIREKIKNAFKKKSNENYDELLELCSTLTEENVYSSVPSRLDYYKKGVSEVKRIFEKAEEIKTVHRENAAKSESDQSEEGQKSLKRAKTQH
jgi:hypothetical protein